MDQQEKGQDRFGEWAVLELMGHRKLGGFVQETTLAGAPFIRIDVPAVEGSGPVTQFYSPASVYCITPTTEETARALARGQRPAPVSRYELPPARPATAEDDGDARRHGDHDDPDF